MDNIFIELEWEDNIGTYEGPVEHEYNNMYFNFDLRISVEEDRIFGGKGTADIWIDDLIVESRYGVDICPDKFYKQIKEAITWD